MAEYTGTVNVAAGQTTATVVIQHNKSGLSWIIWQLSVESNPLRGAGRISSVQRNGRYLTNSLIIPSSAQGPPAINLGAADKLEINFAGMQPNDACTVTAWYEEVRTGEYGSGFGLV